MPPQILSDRPSVRVPDWAAAATEGRRQRDEAAKQRTAELAQQRRQAREAAAAWSPQHEIRALAGALGKAAGVVVMTTVPTPGVPAPSGSPTPQPQSPPQSLFRQVTGQPARRVRAPSPPPPGEPLAMPQILNARALKCTVVLDAAEVAQLVAPDGQPRVVLAIRLPDRRLSVDLSAKSVRKAVAAIAEHGPDGVAVIIQGKLVGGDALTEAGIVAQPKVRPQAAVEAAAV